MAEVEVVGRLETCWSCGGEGCFRCDNGFTKVKRAKVSNPQVPARRRRKNSTVRFATGQWS